MRVYVLPCVVLPALLLSARPLSLAGQQSSPSPAASRSHADVDIAFRFSTLGLGGEVGKLLTSHLSARVGANYFRVSTTKSQSDISYDATLKLHGVSFLLDLYPSRRGSFHFTGGLVTNPFTASGTGQPSASGTFDINDHTYSNAQVGTLIADATFEKVGPYVGLGFGTPARHHPLVFLFDLGAVLGKPHISLTATGAAQNAQLRSDLQAQADKTQHDVRKYFKVYPVLSFGLGYRFSARHSTAWPRGRSVRPQRRRSGPCVAVLDAAER